jgi:hypothetical protein
LKEKAQMDPKTVSHELDNFQELRQIMEDLKGLSSTQIEQKITQLIGIGQTLELAEEQELAECERLGILDLISEKM